MKLYELIELGSTAVLENHEEYLRRRPNGMLCGCALGTAGVAAGFRKEVNLYEPTPLFRFLRSVVRSADVVVSCPACCYYGPLIDMTNHLHSRIHEWPRQTIAEWLKPIEDAFERKYPKPAELETSEALQTLPA